MATVLWYVEVLEVAGDTARLAVKTANADSGPFKSAKEFALRMLYEPSVELDENYQMVALGPIGSALDDDKVASEAYLPRHADDFIASVEVGDVIQDDAPRAVYTIRATDAKWLVHLRSARSGDRLPTPESSARSCLDRSARARYRRRLVFEEALPWELCSGV